MSVPHCFSSKLPPAHGLRSGVAAAHICRETQMACLLCDTAGRVWCDTADMSAV